MIIREQAVAEERLGQKPLLMKALLTREKHTQAISVTRVKLAGRCCEQMTCNISDRVYYLLSGEGEFGVGDDSVERVGKGDLVSVPKGVPYTFSGDMTYLVMNVPAFVPGSDMTAE